MTTPVQPGSPPSFVGRLPRFLQDLLRPITRPVSQQPVPPAMPGDVFVRQPGVPLPPPPPPPPPPAPVAPPPAPVAPPPAPPIAPPAQAVQPAPGVAGLWGTPGGVYPQRPGVPGGYPQQPGFPGGYPQQPGFPGGYPGTYPGGYPGAYPGAVPPGPAGAVVAVVGLVAGLVSLFKKPSSSARPNQPPRPGQPSTDWSIDLPTSPSGARAPGAKPRAPKDPAPGTQPRAPKDPARPRKAAPRGPINRIDAYAGDDRPGAPHARAKR